MSTTLKLTKFSGSSFQCGKDYGQHFEVMIKGFLHQEITSKPYLIKNKKLLNGCLASIETYAPKSLQLMKGMAIGASLPLEQVSLLTLHEEIVHNEHCSAFAQNNLIGQNWDWEPSLFPWPGVLELEQKGSPKTLTYHYPGLWSCAGLNQHGLTLMWTGTGYYPMVKAKVGVPTYILISEILRKKTLKSALSFLENTPRAGCFNFFLMDAKGQQALVEGAPGKIHIEFGSKLCRANHYESPQLIRHSEQKLPDHGKESTQIRDKRIKVLMNETKKMTLKRAKQILTDAPYLYSFDAGRMTVDGLLAYPQERKMWVRRGGSPGGVWRSYSL
jgi:predicted choloylglycine hydrolase